MVSILKLSSILCLAACCLAFHASALDCFSFNALVMASKSCLELLGGTTQPVSPTINAASPTFVVTQGVPQAMASATTFGKPSVVLDSTCTSKAFIRPGISER